MYRRTVLKFLCLLGIGCTRSIEKTVTIQGGNVSHWKTKGLAAMQAAHSQEVTFLPLLAELLLGFLFSMIKQCLLNKLLQQHRAVNRNPNGRIARAMKENIHKGFLKKNPTASSEESQTHVDASVEAFRKLTDIEVVQMYREQITAPHDPDEDMWDAAAASRIIMETDE